MTRGLEQRFRTANQVHARRFDDATIVLDLEHGEYFTLNEVGTAIWERLCEGLSLAQVTDHVVETYDVERGTAIGDVQRLVSELVTAGLLAPTQGG
jgi:Coenzyme PQQ synthesis protein D (PqqD)